MDLNERQYERIANWLDGRDVNLSDAERAAAEEMRRDEKLLSPMATPDIPPVTIAKAKRRMLAELARPAWGTVWLRRAGASAAAAILLIAAAVWMFSDGPTIKAPVDISRQLQMPLETALVEMEQSLDDEAIDMLADEINEFHAELLASTDSGELDVEINSVENEIEDILTDDSQSWSDDFDEWSS